MHYACLEMTDLPMQWPFSFVGIRQGQNTVSANIGNNCVLIQITRRQFRFAPLAPFSLALGGNVQKWM